MLDLTLFLTQYAVGWNCPCTSLHVRHKRWVFLFNLNNHQREAGLGSLHSVPLAKAREKAAEMRAALADGRDPIIERRNHRPVRQKTFGMVTENFLATHQASWSNTKHKQQWRMTLETYAAPLWNLPVDQVDTAAVLSVLQPLRASIPETASRLRGRMETVLAAAQAAGYLDPNVANVARWKSHLERLLPKPNKLTQGHHPALPYNEVPTFIETLHQHPSMSALALEFLILTATRTNEVLGARWDEIDLTTKVWTIPPKRMKAKREHRVPLSPLALAILNTLDQTRINALVFPGKRQGFPLGSSTLINWLKRQEIALTVHGFRSTFRTWAGDQTDFPREICEEALAHVSGEATERAYRRTDFLEKRRYLMQAWADFCLQNPTPD
jgi:integrase